MNKTSKNKQPRNEGGAQRAARPGPDIVGLRELIENKVKGFMGDTGGDQLEGLREPKTVDRSGDPGSASTQPAPPANSEEMDLTDLGEGELSKSDIDNLRTLTDSKAIEIASGDVTEQIEQGAPTTAAIGTKPGTYYRDIIYALIQIRLPEEEAQSDWREILTHKYTMSEKLGRNVGIHVATLDYYTNLKKQVLNPKIVDARDYVDTANRAITDELTKAHNRRLFDEEFRRLFTKARVSGYMFSLIMLDLDHFKVYNDLNGHLQGDFALMQTVRILNAVCSRNDIIARYGGEEFAILLDSAQLPQAKRTAENIRRAIYDYRFPNEYQLPGGRLSVSLGVTSYRGDIKTPVDMIEEADVALYRAKSSGRNTVKVFLDCE